MSHRRVSLFLALLVIAPVALVLAEPAGAAPAATVTQLTITSFDGTALAATEFVPAGADVFHPVPFVLMTHGWAGSRTATLTGRVADLVSAGYGVLTWDSRGFGASGGEVQLDSPSYEVRDVQAIITYVQGHSPVQFVGSKPLIGMSGGSYAGGIQLLSAALDNRITAIAPEITWNDLSQALAPNGVPKAYWTTLLLGAGAASSCTEVLASESARSPTPTLAALSAGPGAGTPGCQTSDLERYYAEIHATNKVTPDAQAALLARSPKTYMANIKVPTLLIQGFPDTLFDVNQAVANYNGIKANGAPVKLWIYDGGHSHPENAGQVPNTQGALISPTVIAWFDCYLKTTADCSRVGAPVEYWTGSSWKSANAWPPAGVVQSVHVNGLPPMLEGAVPTGSNFGGNTITLASGPVATTGSVHVSFDVSSQAPEAFLYMGLASRVNGTLTSSWGQVQPIRVATTLGGAPQHVQLDLVAVHAEAPAGGQLVLTIATGDQNYDNSRFPGFVYVENIDATFSADN